MKALIFCALALLALLCKPAHATVNYTDQGAAFAGCSAVVANVNQPSGSYGNAYCEHQTASTRYVCFAIDPNFPNNPTPCNQIAGGEGGEAFHVYPAGQTCSTRSGEDAWAAPDGTSGPQPVCSEGCKYEQVLDPNSSGGSTYEPTGDTCTTDEFAEPVVDTDGDGVADIDDAFPNDPNESADTDGDGIGDSGDFSPNDPDDGVDTPGEEDGDDEGDNIASGGGDCNAPPSCSGDGIQCAQLHTQWKIMCKGAKVTGSPEVCESSYSCTGDAAQCAEIALLRKTACDGAVVGDSAAQELLDGLKNGPGDQNLDPMSVWGQGEEAEPDDAGFGLARACPPPISVFGKTIDTGPLCDLGGIIAALVLLAGFVQFAYAFTRD